MKRVLYWLIIPLVAGIGCAQRSTEEKRTRPALHALGATSALGEQTNEASTVKAITEEVLAKYRALKTYQDRVTMRYEIIAKSADGEDAGRLNEETGSLAYAKPNRVALVGDDLSVYCDGEHLWTFLPALAQYIESPAPQVLQLRNVPQPSMFMAVQTHPAASMLVSTQGVFSEALPIIRELNSAVPETRNGEPGHRIFGNLRATMRGSDQSIIASFWFSDDTSLLREIRIDFTAAYRQNLVNSSMYDDDHKPPTVEKAQVLLTFDNILLDAEIPRERFVFKPAPAARKVEQFVQERPSQSEQLKLVGKPAPEISGVALDGKPLSLSALRGRVVVLDFWAMWCGPCLMALPHVQELADRFADKPVTVIGINRDFKGSEKRLKAFLEKRKVSYRQFLDPDSHVSEQYKALAIPCHVLIDTNGIIQAIEVGYNPNGQDTLGAQVEQLLQGKSLLDAQKPNASD